MTTTSYLIAWCIYLAAAWGVCAIVWKLSAGWNNILLTHLARYLLVVLVLTPYFSDPAQNKLAPALLIILFEGVFGDTTIAGKALVPLLLLMVAAILLAFLKSARSPKSSAP